MSKIDDFRAQSGNAYDDLSDAEIADFIYRKSYSDMDRSTYDHAMGLTPSSVAGKIFQPFDDAARVVADTATRGFADKALGSEDQAMTRGARDRLGAAALPIDIAAGVATAPYRIGSAGAGALIGAAEGAASAYGHQDSWVPGWDVAVEGAKGAALGSGLSAIGNRLGSWWSRDQAKRAQTYKTDDDLLAAIDTMKTAGDGAEAYAKLQAAMRGESVEEGVEQGTKDLRRQYAKLRAAHEAYGKGREAFKSVPTGSADEAAMAADIASKKSRTAKAGAAVEPLSFGSRRSSWRKQAAPYAADAALHLFGIPTMGAVGTAITGGASVLSRLGKSNWANRISPREMEDYTALLRDPSGRGLRTDPEAVAKAREMLAKVGISYGRSP